MRISKTFRFEASHVLPKHPGKCSRLHGHSWVLTVTVEGPVNRETGFVVDYAELKKLVDEHVVEKLDHTHLGQGQAVCISSKPTIDNPEGIFDKFTPYFGLDFYPSSENLVRAIGKLLQPLITELAPNVRLFEITLDETCTSRASWRPEDDFTWSDGKFDGDPDPDTLG